MIVIETPRLPLREWTPAIWTRRWRSTVPETMGTFATGETFTREERPDNAPALALMRRLGMTFRERVDAYGAASVLYVLSARPAG